MTRSPAGFTLIELVIAITVLGILAGASVVFMRGPITAYFDAERRSDLADAGDLALAKLGQEVAGAVPNSVRVRNAGGSFWLELLPVRSEGRYRTAGTGNPLTFGTPDNGFDVLGPAVQAAAGDWVVVNNHVALADVWAGTSRATYTGAAGAVSTVTHATRTFSTDSAEHRFQMASAPVSYVCDPVAGTFSRISNYGDPAATQPTAFGAGAQNDLLASGVRRCRAAAFAGSLRRAQTVAVDIGLELNGDRLNLAQTLRVETLP